MMLICIGLMCLTLEPGNDRSIASQSVAIAALTGLTIEIYTVIDGYGARQASGPLSFAAWLFVFDGASYIVAARLWRGSSLWSSVRRRWRLGFGSGLIAVGSYGVFVCALALGAMGTVAALREVSVLFAALLGSMFLGERLGRVRIAATVVITAGIVLIARHS
jgi:drug/metabolite transporter (DMT)-like permease